MRFVAWESFPRSCAIRCASAIYQIARGEGHSAARKRRDVDARGSRRAVWRERRTIGPRERGVRVAGATAQAREEALDQTCRFGQRDPIPRVVVPSGKLSTDVPVANRMNPPQHAHAAHRIACDVLDAPALPSSRSRRPLTMQRQDRRAGNGIATDRGGDGYSHDRADPRRLA
jgi:hypothetical protein